MEAEIKRACAEMAEFLIGKNRSYGNSVAAPMGVFAKRADTLLQIDVRIDDKLSRIKKGTDFPGDDTIKDLVGYLILRMIVDRYTESDTNAAETEQVLSNGKQTISVTVPAQFPNDHFEALAADYPEAADVLSGAEQVLSDSDAIAQTLRDYEALHKSQKGDWRPWGCANALPRGVLANDRITVVTEDGTVTGSAASVFWGGVIQWQFTWENVESIPGDGGRIVEGKNGRVGPKCYFRVGDQVRPYTGVVDRPDVTRMPTHLLDEHDWFGRRPRDVWKCANGYYWNLDAYHRRKTCSN